MKRILCSADHHFHEPLRFEECKAVHAWMVDLAREEQVDLFQSAGDVYDSLSTIDEREAVASWVSSMGDVCPVVIARGNHDKHRDVQLMRRLRARHPIIVEEAAAVHVVAGVAVAAVAWPEPSYLLAASENREQADAAVRQSLQNVLRGLGDQLEQHDGPRVLLGHFMVDGSVVSTGQPLLGQPINVGLADLALARAHVGVMGHIHKAQTFDVHGAPHFYCGSPFRTDFGQLEPKTVSIVEFDGQRLVSVRHIPTPCAPMLHVRGKWEPNASGHHVLMTFDDHAGDWGFGGLPGYGGTFVGAEVRLRYRVTFDQRIAARAAADEWKRLALEVGKAKSVKVEPDLIIERRSRVPEIASAVTLEQKLDAHWKSVGFSPDADRRERLLRKARQLEEECAEAA